MALNVGLDGKPWYYGLGIGLVLAVICVIGVQYFLIGDIDAEIKSADGDLTSLDNQIAQGRAAERKLPQFREEVDRLRVELDKLRRILPSNRNTEEIIKKIKALVDQGDFVLRKIAFPQIGTPEGSDPYAEWPIAIDVEGGYHNLAILFNRLSNFSRIINVEQFTITAVTPTPPAERTIAASFTARTFVYVEPSASKVDQPGANSKLSKGPK
jgi:type IV pilus assembly protein PilO